MIRFAVAVYLVLILPRLWTFGMFLDGTIYASIARNMAEGLGGFNAPYYGDTAEKVFYWHPSLAMWLHSLLYRVFGDRLLIDTLYGFIAGSVVVYLVFQILRLVDFGGGAKPGAWGGVLLVSLAPMTSWVFSNNMLEASMAMFVLASVYLQLKGIHQTPRKMAAMFFLAGLCLALAVLSKNVAGLFPLILPVSYYVIFRSISFKKTFVMSLHLAGSALACIWAILYLANSIGFYEEYLRHQLLPSVAGELAGESTGFLRNTWLILAELIGGAVVLAAATFIFKKQSEVGFHRPALFFLLLGISGTLPLFFIPKFRSFYLYPGLVFYFLSMAAFFRPTLTALEKRFLESVKFRRYVNALALLLTFLAVGLFIAGKDHPARLKEFKHDVYDNGFSIPPRVDVADCSRTRDYTMIAAFQRYHKVSLLQDAPNQPEWIFEDSKKPCDIPPKCEKINRQDSLRYNMYKCAFFKKPKN